MAKLLPDGPIDTLGLRDAVLALPEHLVAAGAAGPVDGLVPVTDIDHVVIVAPGSGVAAAEIARVLSSSVATVPVIVQPSGPLPAFVTARSLVIVASADDDSRAAATSRPPPGHGPPSSPSHRTGLPAGRQRPMPERPPFP